MYLACCVVPNGDIMKSLYGVCVCVEGGRVYLACCVVPNGDIMKSLYGVCVCGGREGVFSLLCCP